ncbi:hypothetical protein [Kitasatospora sp. CMC57]|uniref:hypothetical protein n=1 Tax=Kitasatospora sp. CMC57 TaxID=3231513 RepID=UPI0038B67EB8
MLRIAATAALLVVAATVPAHAAPTPDVPSADGHSIPVLAVSDLGSVLTLADVGYDFARLLGQ